MLYITTLVEARPIQISKYIDLVDSSCKKIIISGGGRRALLREGLLGDCWRPYQMADDDVPSRLVASRPHMMSSLRSNTASDQTSLFNVCFQQRIECISSARDSRKRRLWKNSPSKLVVASRAPTVRSHNVNSEGTDAGLRTSIDSRNCRTCISVTTGLMPDIRRNSARYSDAPDRRPEHIGPEVYAS